MVGTGAEGSDLKGPWHDHDRVSRGRKEDIQRVETTTTRKDTTMRIVKSSQSDTKSTVEMHV